MSLVAAYSDSESESEQNESKPMKEISVTNTTLPTNVEIVDEDDWIQDNVTMASSATSSSFFSHLPKPRDKQMIIEEEIDDEFIKIKPTEKMAKPDNEISISEDKSLKRLIDLPRPMKGVKKVKISIPTLDQQGDGSDSEEEKPKMKMTANRKNSSLFTMLPKPRHSVTVGANKNKVFEKQTNRILMPHMLRKKGENKETLQPSIVVNRDSDDDEDDDENTHTRSFFSLQENINALPTEKKLNNDFDNSCKTETCLLPKPQQSADLIGNIPTISTRTTDNAIKIVSPMKKLNSLHCFSDSFSSVTSTAKDNSFFSNLCANKDKISNTKSKRDITMTDSNKFGVSKSSNLQGYVTTSEDITASYGDVTAPYGDVTAPYENVTVSNGGVTAPYRDVTTCYGDVKIHHSNESFSYGSTIALHGNSSSSTSSYFVENTDFGTNSPSFFQYGYHSPAINKSVEEKAANIYDCPNTDTPLDQEALTALVGKRKRKMGEINVIDIKGEDLKASDGEYLKNLTKENVYKSKTLKRDEPRKQEKRKHQITYLAFQAKEREMALRQAWAENRATKQQTQSKYGF